MNKIQFLLIADSAGGNGPGKPAAKLETVQVRNVTSQPIAIDGILLEAAQTSKGKTVKEAPVVEIPKKDRARLGALVEDVE